MKRILVIANKRLHLDHLAVDESGLISGSHFAKGKVTAPRKRRVENIIGERNVAQVERTF
jgi:hypothetical protein